MKLRKRFLAGALAALQVLACLNINSTKASAWGMTSSDPTYVDGGIQHWYQEYDLVNHPDQIPVTVAYQFGDDTTDQSPKAPWYDVFWLDSSGVVTDDNDVDEVFKNSNIQYSNSPNIENSQGAGQGYKTYANYDTTPGSVEADVTFTAPDGYYFIRNFTRTGYSTYNRCGFMFKFISGTKVQPYTGSESADYTSMTYRFKGGSILELEGAVKNALSGLYFNYDMIRKVTVYNVYNGDIENKVYTGEYYVSQEDIGGKGKTMAGYIKKHHDDDFLQTDPSKPEYTYLRYDAFDDAYVDGTGTKDDAFWSKPYGAGTVRQYHVYNYFFDFEKYNLDYNVKYQVVDTDGNPIKGTTLFGETTDEDGFISTVDKFSYSRDVADCGDIKTTDPVFNHYESLDYTTSHGTINANGKKTNRVSHDLSDGEKYDGVSGNLGVEFTPVRTNTDTVAPYAEYKGSIKSASTGAKIIEVDDNNGIVQVTSNKKPDKVSEITVKYQTVHKDGTPYAGVELNGETSGSDGYITTADVVKQAVTDENVRNIYL